MMRLLRNKASVITEYAVIVIVVVSAVLTMAIYMRRSIAGGIKKSADAIGEQYAPGKVVSDMTTTTSGETVSNTTTARQVVSGKNVVTADTVTTIPAANPETTTVTGTETIDGLGTDLWN